MGSHVPFARWIMSGMSRNRLTQNVPGEFFVDSSCINCDTCRQLAPKNFADSGSHSYVKAQPDDAGSKRHSMQALLACPTGSIRTEHALPEIKEVMKDFPL